MKTSLALICILMLANLTEVSAKCAMVKWNILGEIKSSKTRQGIEGAQVFLFLDKNESTYSAGHLTKYPDFFVTDEGGKFVGASYFDTFRKMPLLDPFFESCSKKPHMVEIIVVKPGFKTRRRILGPSDFTLVEEGDMRKIVLPEIYLDESQEY